MPEKLTEKAFVVLSTKRETVATLAREDLEGQEEIRDDQKQHQHNSDKSEKSFFGIISGNRRKLLWECLSAANVFPTSNKKERNEELTAQLRAAERDTEYVRHQHASISSKTNPNTNKNSKTKTNSNSNNANARTARTSSNSPYVPIGDPPSQYSVRRTPQQQQQQQPQQQQQDAPKRGRSIHSWGHSPSASDSKGEGSDTHSWGHTPSVSDSISSHGESHGAASGKQEKIICGTCTGEEFLDFHSTPWQKFKAELKDLVKDLIEYGKAKTWKKKILTVFLGCISMLVFYDLLFGKEDYIITWLHSFIVWMTTHHSAAVFAFVGIFVVSTLAFVPPTLLVFGAGYAFTIAMDNAVVGVTAATISCFLGSSIGATIAFLRSRYLMRDLVKLFANRYPLVRSIDRALKVNHGFRIMLLLRLCPIIPFNGLNYCCGITGVSLHDFTLSLVGILPFQIFTTILGATAGSIELQNLKQDDYTPTEKWALVGFIVTGVLSGIIAIVYIWGMVKQELRKELRLSAEELRRESMVTTMRTTGTNSETGGVVGDGGPSPSFSFHLQESDDDDDNGVVATQGSGNTNDGTTSIAFQEEGEEWFWVWA